ncbi:MAG: transglutaminase-like domain-containing protein, partial [Firmicutes bacterium]|nr:transglutaminase-like domain-containing protein [Bacillota bacterium]
MKRFFIAIVLGLLLLMPAISLAVIQGEENYYGIYWDDKLIGYSQFRLARKVRLAGEDFLIFRSQSRFKVGIGNIEDLSFMGETVINSKSLAPSSFSSTQRVDKNVYGLDCIFSSNLVAQRNKFGPQEQNYYKPLNEVSYLYFNNLWGRLDTFVEHYLIFIRKAEGKDIVIPVYDPILRENGKFSLKFLKKENLKIGKESFSCKVSTVTDWLDEPLVVIWIDEKSGDIIKIHEAGGSISFIKTTPAVAAKVNNVKGIDLWNERVGFSNVYFQSPEVLKYLKAKIKFKVKGNSVLNREITGFSQKFEGGHSNGYYEGTVEIKTSYYNGEGAFSYPIKSQNLTDEFKPYLSPQPTVESDSTMIIAKATELTWKAINALEASQKICKWVSENIKNGMSLPSARLVLDTGEGNSESKALLVLALCRAAGIPARLVGGVVFQNGNFIPHHWVEAYIGKDIWIGLDPTTGEAKRLDASHIALLERGELQSFSIDIDDYEPHPQPRVPFFKKELTWPIGQERVYIIKTKGEVVARESAKVKELTMYKGIDLWNERVGFSNVYFQSPEVLKYLKAKIKFKVKGNSVLNR